MKRKLLFAIVALLCSIGSWAQETPSNNGVYYIYNETNELFLTRGQTWGTQAVAKPLGLPWKVSIADGKYTLRMYDITVAGSNSGFGDNCYSDNGSPLAFTPNGNAADGFTLQNGSNYITCPTTAGAVSLSGTASSWKFLTQAQYDAVLAAKVTAQESAIATLKGITIPDGQSLNDVVTDGDNWRTSATVNDGVPTNSKWSATKHNDRGGNINWNTSYGTEMYQCGNGHYTRTITGLAKGIYKLSIRGMKRMGNNATCTTMGNAGFPVSDTYMDANGYIIRFKAWYEDRVADDNPNSTGAFVDIVNKGGYINEGFVYVGDDGKLVLDASSEAYWGGCWFLFNGISYTYYDNSVSDEDVDALIATIPSRVSDTHADAMESAKNTLLASKTIANYNALVAAIEAAQTSANEYAIINAGTIPTDVMDGWARSTSNGDFHVNTWSTEGNTDGSGMTTPFMENWIGSGNALGAGRVYYSFTDLNPGETYVVTARVRVFNEAGTGVTGATYFVGDNTKPLDDTFSSPCVGDFATKGRFAVLSCAGTVDANGDLQFGVELADGSPINWMAIKDVTIAAGTGDVPTSIELNETNVALTTGGSASLTATITPATADDKTILWSSSDETVATVAGGTIVALKAGTATITARAYAGVDVTASATVTVSDAAAPSYYSTTIEAGDYYIMNAATGAFLGGANSWGTQASLIEHGIPFTVAVGEGVYTLDSHTYNNADDHFFNGTYVDGASTNLYITNLGSGKFSISTADGSAYATALAGSTVVSNTAENTDNSMAQWYFLSKNDRDKMLASTPADATYYVKQANISRNLSAGAQGENAWSQYNVGGTQDNSNYAAQVYNAVVDNYQTIENIPNGTYTVTVQAFTSGTDVKFYANDQMVDVKANDSGVASCSGAAALFAQNKYPNTVTVTVTDRTLKIGFEGDCSGAKWLCYDKVEMYMTSYTANTGLSVSIDKAEIEAGTSAQITAATVPADASFNAITYTSSDETIATVNENGVVTGLAIGTATITVAATEMESFSETIDVTVKASTPTALAFEENEITLNKENPTATLVLVPTPAGANTSVTWISSDESVATVADGVVTALANGTATITATSTLDTEVKAEATVTVAFPEAATPDDYYVNSGATRTNYYTVGENLIKNGAFEYGNTFYGWTAGNDAPMSTAGFDVLTEEGNTYIKSKKGEGGANPTAIKTGWPIEAGKTYVFGYKIKGNAGKSSWTATSLTNTIGTETSLIEREFNITTDWQEKKYTFTNTEGYAYVQIFARWYDAAFDDFYLCEVTGSDEGNVDYATAAIPTANIGTGAFQYSQDAIDAANALVQGTATVKDVEEAYEAVTTLNAPDAEKLYNIVVAESGNAKIGNAVLIKPGTVGANNPTGYGLDVNLAPNTNLNQAVTFTKESGNNYSISFVTTEGTTYLTTGSLNGSAAGWNKQQIQATPDAEKKCAFTIVASTTEDNVFYIYNPIYKDYIDYQDGGSLYTDTNIDHKAFSLVETTKPSITISTTAAGYGTVMVPFAVASLPEGVTVYTCAEVGGKHGNTLILESVSALEANKPYIIEGAWETVLTGDAQGTTLTYNEGLLTGVYFATKAPAGSYVLQKNNDVVGFYQVADGEGNQPPVGANRAYLTVSSEVKALAFFFDEGTATAIQNVFSGVAAGEIYDLSGRKLNKLQKGVNIVNGKKVMVK